MIITAPISVGELLDKISILEIKMEHSVSDTPRWHNVNTELTMLQSLTDQLPTHDEIPQLFAELKNINQIIWDVEDKIRKHEQENNFDDNFIELARQVYINNDERAVVKRSINQLYDSHIIEEKIY